MNQLVIPKKSINVQSEFDLLLVLLKNELYSSKPREIDIQILDAFDWKYFLRLVGFHKVIPLVYQASRQIDSSFFPDKVLSYLKQQSYAIALKNSFHTQELIQILHFFKAHQIPVIPFKGPILAQSVYADIYSRQFCDLDLLVRPEDFERAFELLILEKRYNSPYQREAWDRSFLFKMVKAFNYRFMAHEIALGQKQMNSDVFIDLHKKVSKYWNLNFEILAERLHTTSFLDTSVSTMKVEDALIVLCVHGSEDGWNKFQSISDVAHLLNIYPCLDWSDLILQAQLGRCTRRLLLGLALAKEYYGLSLPTDVVGMIQRDSNLQILINQVKLGMQKNPDQSRSWTLKIKFQIFKMRMLEKLSDKIKHFLVFIWSYFFAKFRRATILKMAKL